MDRSARISHVLFITSAGKNVFGNGDGDELEKAKQKSLTVLKDKAALRGIGNADDFKVEKVEIDRLSMAQAKVTALTLRTTW